MKTKQKFYGLSLVLTAIMTLTFSLTAQAQSTDIDNPTPLSSNVIQGESDGKAEASYYYSLTALKGDVKITIDGKTKSNWTSVGVKLLNEDGSSELLNFSVAADSDGQRTVETKRFLGEQKVILRVVLKNSPLIELVTYKIKIEGAVKLETPKNPQSATEPSPSQPAETSTAPKDKMKKKAIKILDSILDEPR